MAGMDLPLRAIREQIASAIDLIVQQDRLRDGSRKVVNITEVQGMEGDVIIMQDIFMFEQTGRRRGQDYRPAEADRHPAEIHRPHRRRRHSPAAEHLRLAVLMNMLPVLIAGLAALAVATEFAALAWGAGASVLHGLRPCVEGRVQVLRHVASAPPAASNALSAPSSVRYRAGAGRRPGAASRCRRPCCARRRASVAA